MRNVMELLQMKKIENNSSIQKNGVKMLNMKNPNKFINFQNIFAD